MVTFSPSNIFLAGTVSILLIAAFFAINSPIHVTFAKITPRNMMVSVGVLLTRKTVGRRVFRAHAFSSILVTNRITDTVTFFTFWPTVVSNFAATTVMTNTVRFTLTLATIWVTLV